MKKLLALLLALSLILTLAACGNGGKDDDDKDDDNTSVSSDKDEDVNSGIPTLPPSYGDDAQIDADDAIGSSAVEEYINKNKEYLINAMESSLASSGMECKTSIEVIGNGFIITLKMVGVDNIDASAKAQMQSSLNQMQDYYDSLLSAMQLELPELEYLVYELCEEDGDFLADVTAGNR